MREKLVKQCSYYEVQLTNVLDLIFPEFKPFFNNDFTATSLFILNKYKTPDKIKSMKYYDSIREKSREKFTSAQFVKLTDLAKNTIGCSNYIFETELESLLIIHSQINQEINKFEDKIEIITKELNPQTLSIKEIGNILCARIISEFGDVTRFKSVDAMVAFAGIEPSISESGTESHTGHMVKRESGHLRYLLMNAADMVFVHKSIFTGFYYKKRDDGKYHRVALNYVAKKLVRIIYKLESENIKFNRNL